MAAAPTMVCFVKVDPSFQVVMNAINELSANGRLQHVCTVTAGNNGLRSAANNSQFGGLNGFSRTLGSVLRAFMLRSTYLENLHDPDFESKLFNLAGYNRNVQPQGVPLAQRQLVQNVHVSQEISANFDRIYPHFITENKIAAVPQGTWVNLSGMMVIVELQGGQVVKLHTINTTVTARYMGQNTFECPNPNVVRVTSAVLGLQPGQPADMFPRFNRLMEIIHDHLEGKQDDNITDLVANLRIGEEAQQDENDQAQQDKNDQESEEGDDENDQESEEEDDENDQESEEEDDENDQ